MEQGEQSWGETAIRAIAVSGVEILLSSAGVPGVSAGTGVVIEHLISRRRRNGEAHIEAIIARVGGEDALLDAIKSDDERNELLWSSVQAAMAAGIEGKRVYLARVVAQAMSGDSAIMDEARLVVSALGELDGPHIAALTRIRIADDASRAAGLANDILVNALESEKEPILAALVRTGVVLVGLTESGEAGMYSMTGARNYSIGGVNEFGRRLLAELASVEIA